MAKHKKSTTDHVIDFFLTAPPEQTVQMLGIINAIQASRGLSKVAAPKVVDGARPKRGRPPKAKLDDSPME